MHRFLAWALSVACGLGCAAAHAGSLSVMPTRIDFSGGAAVQSVLLTNLSDQTVTIEAQVAVWPEDAPQQLANDIVVTPAVVTLPPNQRTRVRIGMLRKHSGVAEQAYRIYFTELPAPSAPLSSAIGVRLRVGIPVFVAPDEAKPQPLRWMARDTPEGWTLEAANPGNVHTRIGQATLVATGDDRKLQLPGAYVLAGGTLAVPIGRRPAPGARVRWMEGNDEREGAVALP